MSENKFERFPTSGAGTSSEDKLPVMAVYILYLLATFGGLTGIVGVIIAYVYYGNTSSWLDEHFRYQIRTFWIGLLYGVIVALTMFILVGWILWILWIIWMLVRSIKGLKALQENRAPANVDGWF